MPREKIELVGPSIKVHSVSRHGAVIINAEYIGPVGGVYFFPMFGKRQEWKLRLL